MQAKAAPAFRQRARLAISKRHRRMRVWLVLACLPLAAGPLCAASALAGSSRVSGLQIGLHCETQPPYRRVSRYDFVVDRVTDCRPLAFGCPETRDAPARSRPQASVEDGPTLPRAADLDSKSPIPADRLAAWATGRRRLANAQYDRSVRALRDRFRGAAR